MMTIQQAQNQQALLARQLAKAAKKDKSLNDAADAAFVAAVQMKCPKDLLPE